MAIKRNAYKNVPHLFCDDIHQEKVVIELGSSREIAYCFYPSFETTEASSLIGSTVALSEILFHQAESLIVKLFWAHGPWQEKNRLVLYHGLLGSFKEDYDVERFGEIEEIQIETNDKVRFATTIGLSASTFLEGTRILANEASAVMYLKKRQSIPMEFDTEVLFDVAFQQGNRERVDWVDCSQRLIDENTVLVRPYGTDEEGDMRFCLLGYASCLEDIVNQN